MVDYISGLNDPQREAVMHGNGPLMIIAGAGSGKTRVLTYRIAHLIEKGVDPFRILSLTFTNKAAGEMRKRIENVVGTEARNIWMGGYGLCVDRSDASAPTSPGPDVGVAVMTHHKLVLCPKIPFFGTASTKLFPTFMGYIRIETS